MTDGLQPIAVAAPIITALLMAWIAYRQFRLGQEQFRLAQHKVRLDLYQRRFAVYERTLSFYHALTGSVEEQRTDAFSTLLRDFITSYRESQFLFDDTSKIFPLLKEFHAKAFKVIGFKAHGAEIMKADPGEFQRWSTEAQQALAFFDKAIGELESAIAPYLDFRRVLA